MALPRMTRNIEYRDVGFRYADSGAAVLRRVSFSAAAGEVVAIVATSGAGKTTLVNLLPRFYDVTEGSVLIDGVDVRGATLASLREQIGLVTQETILFNDTVRANIAYGLKNVDEARLESAARAAFAHDFILDLPAAVRHRDRRAGEPPLGGAAAADRHRPGAPQGPADPDPRRGHLVPRPAVREARAGSALQPDQGTHDARDRPPPDDRARTPTRIVVLDGGTVREIGTHDELLKKGGIYSRLHDLQFRPEDPAL